MIELHQIFAHLIDGTTHKIGCVQVPDSDHDLIYKLQNMRVLHQPHFVYSVLRNPGAIRIISANSGEVLRLSDPVSISNES